MRATLYTDFFNEIRREGKAGRALHTRRVSLKVLTHKFLMGELWDRTTDTRDPTPLDRVDRRLLDGETRRCAYRPV